MATLKRYSYTSDHEKLLARIEKIIPNPREQQEEVQVTFWKAVLSSQKIFQLSQIC